MAQAFYSPMPENKGAALFVTVRPNNGKIIFTLVKQTSYDADARKGGFAGGKRINVQLSVDETSGIIDAIRNRGEIPIFHTYDKVPTAKGKFNYYETETKKGFGLKISKEDVEFKVGFTLGSAERLAQYLEFALVECFKPDFESDLRKEAAFQERVRNNPKPRQQEPEPEQQESVTETASELDW